MKKIGVHGQSLGGMVACHLAKHANLEYLCADRTFSTLTSVARLSFGPILGKIYLWVTGWSDDSSPNFKDANCYKVLLFSPNDEVIPLLASLRVGVANKVTEKLLEFDSGVESIENPKKKNNFFTARGFSIMKIRCKSWFKMSHKPRITHDYHELLAPNQIEALYPAMKRLVGLVTELAKVDLRAVRAAQRFMNTRIQPKSPGVELRTVEKRSLETSAEELKTQGDDMDESAPFQPVHPTAQLKKGFPHPTAREANGHENADEKIAINLELPTISKRIDSYIPLLKQEDVLSEDFHLFIKNVN